MFRPSRPPFVVVTAALLLALSPGSRAQENKADDAKGETEEKAPKVTLGVGDPAPPLKVQKFLKGEPVQEFKPGHIYVIEFWATWCGPCIRSMPHLTELQKKFKDKVTFIGVNIWEEPYDDETITRVREFMKKHDEKMGYTVAFDGPDRHMDKAYMQAAGEDGIPAAFIVSGDGKIAHIGHPTDPAFEKALEQLIEGKFDMAAAAKAHKERRAQEEEMRKNFQRVAELDLEANALIDEGKIDEALAKYDEALKLAPLMAQQIEYRRFDVLMTKEKYERAYAIAEKLIDGPFKDDSFMLNTIAWRIVDPEAKVGQRNVDLALKAAERGVKLTEEKEPAVLDTLARCYWLKGDKSKAITLQTKAVELARDNKELHESLQKTLDEYKKEAR